MSATTFVLAIALLSDSPSAPFPSIATSNWPEVQTAIRTIATSWELLDLREDRFRRREELETDLNELRRRRQELAGAPPLADAFRLPPRPVAEEFLRFNRAYRSHLERRQQMETDATSDLRKTLDETDELHRTWEAIRDARCDVYYVCVRRAALMRLRTLLGNEGYQAGQLPPPVPIWRFVELK